MMFIQGFPSNKDAEIRSRILTRLEMDSKLTLQNIIEEFQHMMNSKLDTSSIEEKDIS